jgi:hypothetical protein
MISLLFPRNGSLLLIKKKNFFFTYQKKEMDHY